MFHAAARETYDVAICMYHDQALIPAKALGFDDAVNVTLGLPFIRTSPDHGTAFSLAGTGKAKPTSLIAALKMAAEMAGRGGSDGRVIGKYGLDALKSLGQNFLLDLNITQKIARTAGKIDDATVIEIGPGPGGLTRALLSLGARQVVAIERDRRAIPALEEIAAYYPGRLTIVEGDALSIDLSRYKTEGVPLKVVANLPYNIGTQLLLNWLMVPWPPFWQSLTLMFQKEVGERIVAEAGDDHYGRLGVLCGWLTHAEMMFDLS
eukprot:gene15526-20574_t